MRMATLIAGFGLHIARGFFAGHPGGNRIAMHPKGLARFFHAQAFLDCHPRAHGAEGRAPEHRSREAQRAACRSAAGWRSRQSLEAASAESEGP